MKTRKRDRKGKFSAKNPRNILLRVTKQEKNQIEKQRIEQFFIENAFDLTSKELVLDAALAHYPSYKEGEVTDNTIFNIFYNSLFTVNYPTKVILKRSVAPGKVFASKTLGYEILIQYPFPWEFIIPLISEDPSLLFDLQDIVITSFAVSEPFFRQIGYSISGPTNSIVEIKGVTLLNFRRQIINHLKEITDYSNYFLYITNEGEILSETAYVKNRENKVFLTQIDSDDLSTIQKIEYDDKSNEMTADSNEILNWVENLESQAFEIFTYFFLERYNTWR